MTGSQFRFFSFLLVVLTLGVGGLLFWIVADEDQLDKVRRWVRPEEPAPKPNVNAWSNDERFSASWPSGPTSGEVLLRLEREKALLQAELNRTKSELAQARAELSSLKRPLEEDVVSSSLSAELKPGEVLVTGGFQTADGAVQLTFVEPVVQRGPNGKDLVTFSTRQVAIDSALVEELGVSSLKTTAGNVLQHGEAWSAEDYRVFMEDVLRQQGANVLSSPKITTGMGQSARVAVGEYRVEVSAEGATSGEGLNVQLRVEMPREIESGITPEAP